MTIPKNISKKLIGLSALCLMIVLLPQKINAQVSLPFTVAPARQFIELEPGEETTLNLKFYNLGNFPIPGIIRSADFIVQDKLGTPRLIEDVTEAPPRFAASTWFTLPYDRMTLPSEEQISVPIKITVPSEARPGGRYVSVYFEPNAAIPQSVNSSQEAGASIAPRVAGLFYIRVKGPITENSTVSRFFTPSFLEYGPIPLETEILNSGDYHVRPKGLITLSNMFGANVAQVNLKEFNIFPDTQRLYENQIGSKWMVGKYTLSLTAGYGEQGKALKRTTTLWIFPWKIATAIIVTMLIVLLLAQNFMKRLSTKEELLATELQREREEIEKLKQQIRKRNS